MKIAVPGIHAAHLVFYHLNKNEDVRRFKRLGHDQWVCPDCDLEIQAEDSKDLMHLPCHEGYVKPE